MTKILDTQEQLQEISHPLFIDGEIVLNSVYWEIPCKNCGVIHHAGLETEELDPCCSNPKFTRDSSD